MSRGTVMRRRRTTTVLRGLAVVLAAFAATAARAQSTAAPPATPSPPPRVDTGQPGAEGQDAARDAAARGLDDSLADVNAGGLGEALSSVPNFIGDGCAPGAGSSQVPIGRLAIASLGMRMDAAGSLQGQASTVYKFPDTYDSVGAIQAAGITGIPAGAVPLTTIGGPIVIGVTNPAGGPGSIVAPGNDYPAFANNAFQALYPGATAVTTFVPSASGFIPSPITPGALAYDSYAFYDYVVDTAVLIPGANVGFVKLSENVSPLPRDRVYFNYSYFYNALFGGVRNDVNRFTPGFEKTFADGWTSIEVRTPFAATIASTQTLDPADPCGIGDARDVEFGNMSVIFKSIIALGDTWAWTGGMQVMTPTAENTVLNAAGGGPPVIQVNNHSTRLMPFVAGIWAPNDTWFSQSLLQVDTAANGNPTYVAVPGQAPLQYVGDLQYPTFMYLSFSTGYWAYRSTFTRLTGVAPIAEIHVNQALQSSDVIRGQSYQLGADYGVVSLVNGLVGCNFEWGDRSTLTFAYVTPFGGGVDRWFDGEFRAFWNWRFGPQNRLTRVQF